MTKIKICPISQQHLKTTAQAPSIEPNIEGSRATWTRRIKSSKTCYISTWWKRIRIRLLEWWSRGRRLPRSGRGSGCLSDSNWWIKWQIHLPVLQLTIVNRSNKFSRIRMQPIHRRCPRLVTTGLHRPETKPLLDQQITRQPSQKQSERQQTPTTPLQRNKKNLNSALSETKTIRSSPICMYWLTSWLRKTSFFRTCTTRHSNNKPMFPIISNWSKISNGSSISVRLS